MKEISTPWERVQPPIWWDSAQRHIIADRHLPNGIRQHLVQGSVEPGLVIANAEVIGEANTDDIQYSEKPSHLSAMTIE